MAVIKSIIPLKNVGLSTGVESKVLVKGKPDLVRFVSEQEYKNLSNLGLFRENTASVPPVIQGPTAAQKAAEKIKVIPPPTPDVVENKATPVSSVPIDRKCDKCGAEMHPVTDEAKPGVDILYCTKCTNERIVGEQGLVASPPEKDKAPRVYSICPECGKRKSKDSKLCKKCTADEQKK
jgi:hypothetical protein